MSRIPDLTFFHPGSYLFKSRYLICIKEFKYFNPKTTTKNCLYSIENIIRVVDPRSRIRLQILAIPDPGSWGQKATGPWIPNPDPESGSATLQKVL
jgi:hypothetical protein